MNEPRQQSANNAAPNMELVAVVAHLPAGALTVPVEQIQQYDPAGRFMAYADEAGNVRVLYHCVFESIMKVSPILRPA
jgi:hypothetical protein